MSFGYVEVNYTIRNRDMEEYRVTGIRVGRWAVRKAGDDHPGLTWMDDEEAAEYPWRVDHIPTGLIAAAFATPEDAYAFADDISRFSLKDPASKNTDRVMAQIGTPVRKWAAHVRDSKKYVPFREWLAEEHGKHWSPRGRRWRNV